MARSWLKRSRMPPFTTSFISITPSAATTLLGDHQRCAPRPRDLLYGSFYLGRHGATAALRQKVGDGIRGPFANLETVQIHARHAGPERCEGHEMAVVGGKLAPAEAIFFLGQHHIERPSGVSSASEESCAASARSASVTPGSRDKLGCLPVAQCDRASPCPATTCSHLPPLPPRAPDMATHCVAPGGPFQRMPIADNKPANGGGNQAHQQPKPERKQFCGDPE